MKRELPQPDQDRLSALTALVLLTYTLLRIVILPSVKAEFAFLGLIFRFEFDTRFVMLSLAAGLAATGADWLIRSHPKSPVGQARIEHWVVPGIAALGTGTILTRLPEGLALWIGLILTAILLIAVFVAEFILIDAEDPRRDMAAIGLRALTYLLLIGALSTAFAANLRVIFASPLIFLACAGVSWRLFRLEHRNIPAIRYAILIGIITVQVSWGLHYWPIPPLRSALLLGLTVYLGNGLALAHHKRNIGWTRMIEFGLVFVIALIGILTLA